MSHQETLYQIRRKAAIPSNILFVILAIAVEAMMFGGLISAHLVNTINFTQGFNEWPPPGTPLLPIEITSINTLILLISSITMVLAVRASKKEKKSALRTWVGITLLLGLTFVSIQGFEWYNLLNQGLSMKAGSSVVLKEPLPKYVESKISFGQGLHYNPEIKQLTFKNPDHFYTKENFRDVYISWSDNPEYIKAIDELLIKAKGRGIKEEISVPLENLPVSAVFKSLRGQVEYFESSKVLRWVGVLSESIRDQLLSLSKNENYELSVLTLYNKTQSNFGSYFYTIIGMHAFHVIVGLIVLLVLLISVVRTSEGEHLYHFVSATRIYWFFVVFLWPFLYYFVFIFKPVMSASGQ